MEIFAPGILILVALCGLYFANEACKEQKIQEKESHYKCQSFGGEIIGTQCVFKPKQ